MPIALETFVKNLTDSGIIASGKLENFIPPKAHPKDAQELARQLVQSKQLTKYQAAEIYQGRAKSLILGNYTILDKIGSGGMGHVYKAEHRRMKRVVAIKMLPTAVMKDVALAARFQREVEAAAKLSHPNIVAAHDADEANGVNFLVMEYVEGQDLSALVKRDGPVSLSKAINYVLQAARGLEFAHAEGVIHRDIKPANLLLDKKGTVKILDMGLARIEASGDTATQAELTGTGAVMGTVDYMAPEQALSTKHAEARSDIYSLGCTLYYLVAGKPTYDGDSLMAKLLAHRERPIPSLGAEVPEQVQAIFEKMVAKNANDRYQTMSEVVADLQGCVSSGSTVGGSKTSVEAPSELSSLSFLQGTPSKKSGSHTVAYKKPAKPALAAGKGMSQRGKLAVVGGGLLALILLAGVLLKIRTKDGTLVIEIDQPDAVVQVLNAEGKVEVTKNGDKGTISISVDPGKHRLKIEKQGFVAFGRDFVIQSGGKQSIRANLEEDKPWFTPEFKKWENEVAALPAEEQVQAVSKKLQELNLGFDGEEKHGIAGGVVTLFFLDTDQVADISPLRAFTNLGWLHCSGSGTSAGKLADLSPLRGMKIGQLYCMNTQISDLSPLLGMPLTVLCCERTQVSELKPLEGMKLSTLSCWNTKVSDLSPVRGMPLTMLLCFGTPVSDLSPLRGMKLEKLSCSWTQVSDLSPLEGMQLTHLFINGTTISDLTPLRGMNLSEVVLTPTNIKKGMDHLRKMSRLSSIALGTEANEKFAPAEFWKKYDAGDFGKPDSASTDSDRKPITTFKTLAFKKWANEVASLPAEEQVQAVAKKLQELNPGFDGVMKGIGSDRTPQGTPKIENGVVTGLGFSTDTVTDISPVRGLTGLSFLDCSGSGPEKGRLSDLSPLKRMRLANLSFQHTKVSDLSPLRGMPLWSLMCDGTQVADLSPIQGMPLSNLGIAGTKIADLSPLKGMKLAFFSFDGTLVTDISPLSGMPLNYVHFRQTKVADLSPLSGSKMSLRRLSFSESPVSDVSQLEGMKLTELYFTPKNITKGIDVVRDMKTIEHLGTHWWAEFTPEEFWKKYDAGDFGKPDSMTVIPPPSRSHVERPRLQEMGEASRRPAGKRAGRGRHQKVAGA